ncbi:hypothetical protein ATY76_11825 [Rhizobium sp. R339]|uniref:hypothetical protein n=1 Tax=Rhizobium sp. R339 TaxID=1764273 RepID=UPI000B52B9ED|nr:hypothetical protein [Rhizobium sp. R339]OWV69160.1 hypothetical protein ATY76_11825 [Rhizobium sp. R339]
MELDQHRLTIRIAASLAVAILAYLGLLFGGNLVLSPAAAVNTLSSSGRDPQAPQLTAREALRGVLAAERKLAPKQTTHDAGSSLLAAVPPLDFDGWAAAVPFAAFKAPLRAAVSATYQPRAPPAVA